MVIELVKSHSNTSTSSVESGIFEEIFEDIIEPATSVPTQNVGEKVRQTLVEAKKDKRIIIGLKEAISYLTNTTTPEQTLFCFLTPSKSGDSANHMHLVLLKAFCFENDIYIIQLDSPEKLSRILGSKTLESCALVQRTSEADDDIFSNLENSLIDHCEAFWDELVQPVVKLPEK